MINWDDKMNWWDNESRTIRRTFLSKRNLFDQMIWSSDLINWILLHYIIIQFFMHERFDHESHLLIWNNLYRRFFINLLTSRRVVLRSFSRDDFFHIYWFSRSSRDQWARRWVCDSDEIRSKWQRSSKTAWSKENNLVTIKDLDSQRDLDESWDERSIDKIVRRKFLYIELDFPSRLERQQLAIHSFVSQ
jgi:hypothetical protein